MRLIRTVVIGLVAFAPIMFGMMAVSAQELQPPVSQAPASVGGALTVHGPFEVTAQDMAQRNTPEWLSVIERQAPNSSQSSAPGALPPTLPTTSDMLAALAGGLADPDAGESAPAAASAAGPGRIDAPSTLTQTPAATTSWTAAGLIAPNFPPDPTIAASATHLVVTGQAIAAYDKAGKVVIPTESAYAFFSPMGKTLSDTLGLNGYFDTRAIYDSYRDRFWVTSLVQNNAYQFSPQRLTKFVVAVSKTSNPADGWHQYYWDAVANDGTGLNGDQLGYGGDYDSIGIDATAFYETNSVSDVTATGYPRQYWHVSFVPATSLADGIWKNGWHYWTLTNPPECGGNLTPSGVNLIQPAVHHGSAPRAYLVSRCSTAQAVVWAITDPLGPSQKIQRLAVGLEPFQAPVDAQQPNTNVLIRMSNLSNGFLKAVYRDNSLYLTGMDARSWYSPTDKAPYTSIRLAQLDVSAFPTTVMVSLDRTFGGPAADDPPAAHGSDGWPALEVNKNGAVALVYARTGDLIAPEMRYVAYFPSEGGIRPSRLLWAGEASYTITSSLLTPPTARWGDNAGAAVDPFDDTSIWLAHQYPVPYIRGKNFGLAIGVSKVFGPKEPDWVVGQPPVVIQTNQGLCCAPVPPGDPIEIVGTFYNQGDGAAPASLANVFLSTTQAASLSDTLIGQMTVGALASGATLSVTQTLTVPLAMVPGLYYVTVTANANNQFAEYSTTNDSGATAVPILVAHPGPWLPLITR